MKTKTQLTNRILSLVLTFVMIMDMLPMSSFTALAADTPTVKNIMLGASHIKGTQASNVYFGQYQQSSDGNGNYNFEPIKWRVLSNADGKLFLLSDQTLDAYRYHVEDESVTWETSTIRSWLNGNAASSNIGGDSGMDYTSDNFLYTAFSVKEQGAILDTMVVNNDNPDYETEGGNNTNDRVFLLSIAEASDTSYFADNDSREASKTDYMVSRGGDKYNDPVTWWLRSPGVYEDSAAVMGFNGIFAPSNCYTVNMICAVRPAFNLNLNSVLFTSAANGGKPQGFHAVEEYTGNEYKLTLLDSRRNFAVSDTTAKTVKTGDTLSLGYTGATTDADEYISAMIADENDEILYYGTLASVTSNSGTVEFTVPSDLAAGTYTLKLLNEQINGDYKTDYASDFIDIALTVETSAPEPTTYDLWVGGEQFTSDELIIEDGNGGTATYDPDNNILTLNGYNYTGDGYMFDKYGDTYAAPIYYGDSDTLNLVLEGENSVIQKSETSPYLSFGIYSSNAKIELSGTGSLVCKGGSASDESYGIYARGNVSITNCDLFVTGNDTAISAYDVIINSGKVNVEGGSNAFLIDNLTIHSGVVTATGGEYGIYDTLGSVTINGGLVTIKGIDSYGINVGQNIEISGDAVVEVSGGSQAQMCGRFIASSHFVIASENADGTNPVPYDKSNPWGYKYIKATPIYSVSFDANGGAGEMSPVSASGEYILPECTFTAPTGGKQFKGWATSANGDVITTETISVTADTTLYAIWEKIPAEAPSVEISGNLTLTYGEFTNQKITAIVDKKDGYSYEYQWVNIDNVVVETSDTLNIPDNLSVGTYDYACVVFSKRNDNGESNSIIIRDIWVKVNAKELNSDSAEVTLSPPTFIYNGEEQRPDVVTVTYNGKVLTEGDYTISWPDDCKNAGIKTVTVNFKGNYSGSAQKTFEITKAPLTVTANNKTITYGDAPTNNGVIYSGFVPDENADVLDGTLSYSYTYNRYGKVGDYDITVSGLTSDNYNIDFLSGTLTVQKKEITITVEAKNTIVNTALPTYTYKVEGLVGEDKLVTEPTLTSDADITVIGEYDITATDADAGDNYSIKYVPAKLTVLTDDALNAAAGYTEELKGYDPEAVTSEDKAELDEILDEINTILDGEYITDNGKNALEEVKEQVEKLIKEITDAADASDTENTEKVKDITTENITPDDKTDLEKAKEDLEKALEDNGGNYTEDEKKAIEDEIKRIIDALEVIGNVEAVEELIDKLPDTIKKDDEAAIKAADDAYNALTDYEKSLVDKDAKKALDDAKAALAELNKPDDPNSPATGDNSNMFLWIALLFISGGAVITLTVVDRKRKAKEN